MSAPVIRRANFVDEAHAAIKQLIVSGELRPGVQLKMESLSRELGMSSSPIREALRRLENERWVHTIPFRGAFVRPFDERELRELYEIREFIELGALRKLLRREPRPDWAALGEANAAIQAALQTGDSAGYLAADIRFHQSLVDLASNRRLSEMFATLVEQGKCFMLGRTPEAMAQQREETDQHTELLALVSRGDAAAALQLLEDHLRVTLAELKIEN